MTTEELTALCKRVRCLFGGQMDEDIWAIQRKWIRDQDHAVCDRALEAYAVDYGGSVGRFIPAKYREYIDRETARMTEQRRRERSELAKTRSATEMQIGVTAVEVEMSMLRRAIRAADPVRVEDAKAFLERLGWTRPTDDDPKSWPTAWVVAVSDLAHDREIDGLPATAFYRRAYPSNGNANRRPS